MSTALLPARQGISLRPDRDAVARDWVLSFHRYAAARVLGELRKTAADAILREHWADDHRAGMMLKSPVEVMKQSDLPGISVIQLMRLAPRSSVAQFSEHVTKVDLTGVTSFEMPLPSNFAVARFIAEGAPIPVVAGSFSGLQVGPPKTLALISVLSNEIENASAGVASVAIGRALEIAIGGGAAGVMFSDAAATDEAPAGLLYGTVPIAGSADIKKDLRGLFDAISDAGISTNTVVLIAASAQALSLQMEPWPKFNYPVIEAHTLADGTVIAVAADAVVMSGEGIPRVETRKQSTLHMSDTPQQIGTPGAPATVADPTVDLFQSDSFALRVISRLTWSAAPGSVAVVTGAMW